MTEAQWQQMTLQHVGAGMDGTSAVERQALDSVTPQINNVWQSFASRGYYPYLQYYYVVRQCVSLVIARLRVTAVNKTLGPLSVQAATRIETLKQMWQDANGEIERLEKEARAMRRGAVVPQTAEAPLDVGWHRAARASGADPNDPKYMGSPF